MGFKVVVISLEGQKDRQERCSDLLSKQNVPFDFLMGVDAAHGHHPLMDRASLKGFLYQHGRPFLGGEIGCYASHYLAWQLADSLNEKILVLEDDFNLVADAMSYFDFASEVMDLYQIPFLRLEPFKVNQPRINVLSKKHFIIDRFLKIPQSTTAYLISPECARIFIENSKTFNLPVDVFIRQAHLHKVPIYGFSPAPVSADISFDSIIGPRNKSDVPVRFKITRIYYRIKFSIFNLVQDFKFYFDPKVF